MVIRKSAAPMSSDLWEPRCYAASALLLGPPSFSAGFLLCYMLCYGVLAAPRCAALSIVRTAWLKLACKLWTVPAVLVAGKQSTCGASVMPAGLHLEEDVC